MKIIPGVFLALLLATSTAHAFTNLAFARTSSTASSLCMAEIGDTGIAFEHVAREWRCKYSPGPSGGPGDSASLKAVRRRDILLLSFFPVLDRTITRK
jgi:hypothetical protein